MGRRFRFPVQQGLSIRFELGAMSAPAGVTEADMRSYIHEQVESDLAFILQENGVPLALQYNLTQVFTQLRRFSALADTRQGVRQALRDDLQVEENSLQNRAAVAGVVAAWEASKEYATKQAELKAEARLLGISRPVTQTDRAAMRAAYVATHGEVEETFEPSDDYLSSKIEELEAHEPVASYLNEVTSKKTAKTMGIQTSVDSAGHVRIVRSRQKGQLPQGTEELRTVLRVEGNTWCYLAAKYRNNPMLHGLTPGDWLKYTNHLLGDKCYLLKIPGQSAAAGSSDMVSLRPPWNVMLSYEYELRKEAVKRAFRKSKPLRECLEEVCADAQLKEQYFTSPIALQGKTGRAEDNMNGGGRPWRRPEYTGNNGPPNKWHKGSGKKGGKGKSKKGQSGKGSSEHALVSFTDDNRQICFAYNAQGCKGGCNRVHVCRVRGCGKAHPMWQHYQGMTQSGDNAQSPKN